MNVCIYECVCICLYTFVFEYVYVCVCVCMCMFVCVSIWADVCVFIYVCLCVCVSSSRPAGLKVILEFRVYFGAPVCLVGLQNRMFCSFKSWF